MTKKAKAKPAKPVKAKAAKKSELKAFKLLPNVGIDTNVGKGLFCKLVNTKNNADLTHPLTKDEFSELEDLIDNGEVQAILDHPKTLRPGYINKNLKQ